MPSTGPWDVCGLNHGHTQEDLSYHLSETCPAPVTACALTLTPDLISALPASSVPPCFGLTFGLLFPADQAGHQGAEPHQGAQGKPSSHNDAQQWHFHPGGQEPCRWSSG